MEWRKRAECLDDRFVDAWMSGDPDCQDYAKRVCAVCPVVDECLDDALSRNEQFGVWGGLTPDERRRLRWRVTRRRCDVEECEKHAVVNRMCKRHSAALAV